jgi:hypothetical protein
VRARCTTCSEYWNLSIYQDIPKTGYECPQCNKKKRKKSPKVQQHRSGTNKICQPYYRQKEVKSQ